MKYQKKIGVVVLNWNNYSDSQLCVEGLISSRNESEYNLEIFLIDNNSTDGSSIKLFEEYGDKVNFFNTGYNGGYTYGNNFGIKEALSNGCDYVFILNNDLEFIKFNQMLDTAINVLEFDPNIGVLGFDIHNYDTGMLLPSETNIDKVLNKLLKIDTSPIYFDGATTYSNKRSVCGCALLFRSTCLDNIGLFDESFFMYAEEQDICLRAISQGWTVCEIHNPQAKILRKIDPISENQLIWFYGTRNIFMAYSKNLNGINKFIFPFLQVLIYTKSILSHLLKKRGVISKKIFKGLFDAFFVKSKGYKKDD
ncbi:hypothetical protein GCM10008107_02900 [Psychrosphaera saromensis]|uniref:Glycosyltransferase 2-like domain-containing protein n=1 Tax=Psychrosphaera saromensis TaxID=716813 RepID=A0A2S7UXN2_9GAMM|nr:glycosyltransferase family 2 protein [Psychrosphaera saromensis]PQJ54754.1 hypothetical protein BTO11_14580 [Psychrosphaera saromensis]GHB57419.1 hypothetical protein GCM10008107_02900 [Psychrosphaera saromensis]GLQ14012.1 hypothetical protein GCM10007917_14670 [Psychrosphaera saromensis]